MKEMSKMTLAGSGHYGIGSAPFAMELEASSAAMTLQRVVKSRDNGFMLGPLDFEVKQGLVTAVLGPNGSGKSTLFRLIMNLLKPEEGEIAILGGTAAHIDVRARIGYVPDLTDYAGIAKTVGELADFYAFWYPRWSARQFTELLDAFRLSRSFKLKSLSKGMERKLAFSLALSQEPDFLLLDEPTSGMDMTSFRLAMDFLQSFMEEGNRTILLATHSVEEVKRLADYIVFLDQGSVHGVYEKDSLFENWRRVWVDRMPENPGVIAGVRAVEMNPTRLITEDWQNTERDLNQRDIRISHVQPLELDELAGYLHQEKR
ncbi:ABC transporter ATP-binding protein [Gorillibacterium massiliense]|uniref:ABC transporter ATP-binding protein n=1 Tax=Gorillibacterium massiliense TaxID=1280390 RepID=UPI0004B72BED|nr:ABC transporter ATP-binding protein [Gorillibacterium massiliense]